MKRIAVLFLALFLMQATSPVFAQSPEELREVRFHEIKAIKDKQRAERDAKKKELIANPNAPHEKGFWEKEGERSGLGGNGNRFGTIMKNLNPVPFFKDQDEKYKARKASPPEQK